VSMAMSKHATTEELLEVVFCAAHAEATYWGPTGQVSCEPANIWQGYEPGTRAISIVKAITKQ
jgi:hypothetical protein